MNQILTTDKLYITPELKRKKKAYKVNFLFSIFLICILVSLYIYAEYDRNKSEEVSQAILENMGTIEDTTVADNNILVVVLNDDGDSDDSSSYVPPQTTNREVQTTSNGYKYVVVGTVNIPKINVKYPIFDGETDSAQETEALLKISPTRFWGPEPNEVGNFCIVGHNYRNKK